MNANLTWLLPSRVLYWKLTGDITTEEFQDGLAEIQTIIKESNKKIHVIVNARGAKTLTGGRQTLRELARSIARHPQMGFFIVISYRLDFKHQVNMVTADFGTHLRYSNNFANAWKSLHNIDSSLPYVAPNLASVTNARKYA